MALEGCLVLGGADLNARLATAAESWARAGSLKRRLRTLSGGPSLRAGLTALAIACFDAVPPDKPTSHLDDDGLDRLPELLRNRATSCSYPTAATPAAFRGEPEAEVLPEFVNPAWSLCFMNAGVASAGGAGRTSSAPR